MKKMFGSTVILVMLFSVVAGYSATRTLSSQEVDAAVKAAQAQESAEDAEQVIVPDNQKNEEEAADQETLNAENVTDVDLVAQKEKTDDQEVGPTFDDQEFEKLLNDPNTQQLMAQMEEEMRNLEKQNPEQYKQMMEEGQKMFEAMMQELPPEVLAETAAPAA